VIGCDVRIKFLENRTSGSEFGLIGGGRFVGREISYIGQTEKPSSQVVVWTVKYTVLILKACGGSGVIVPLNY
jgi:hypothetical protein